MREIEGYGLLCFANGIPAISRHDLVNSLERLTDTGRVVVSKTRDRSSRDDQRKYKLSQQTHLQLEGVQKSAERRLERIVGSMFKNVEGETSNYLGPFLECLCIIFSQLGEMYARVIKGSLGREELVEVPTVVSAIKEIRKRYPSIKPALFENSVRSFFQEARPDYDDLKWTLAQNHYINKALGQSSTRANQKSVRQDPGGKGTKPNISSIYV